METTETVTPETAQPPTISDEFKALPADKKAGRFGRLYRAVGNREHLHWNKQTRALAIRTLARKEDELEARVLRNQQLFDGSRHVARTGRLPKYSADGQVLAKLLPCQRAMNKLAGPMRGVGEDIERVRVVRKALFKDAQ